MKTIAIDFDGVIHAYSRGWSDGTIYDPPVPGALDCIKHLMAFFNVFIFSARPAWQIQEWMHDQDCHIQTAIVGEEHFWQRPGVLGITNRKLPAEIYLDDRGLRFDCWPSAMANIFLRTGLFDQMRQAVEHVNPHVQELTSNGQPS